ncbi:AraC family transcriptional regulator [Sphaerochaeta sp.]|jgi:YesN/AraC family two-component response regulator|uniref:AraC family transcriptional regulator n=1 Tax=Sphaerochaeta sp. TaxID=1972642 RepID=UPI002FC99C4D
MRNPNHKIINSRTILLFLTALVLCSIILILSQHWMLTTVRKDKQEQTYEKLQLIRSTTDLSMDQMFKLSQLLLLDNDIAKFIYQAQVPSGSYEIQTIIDAKALLPTSTSINAMLAEIYVYSNRSGYILSSHNAFLDPEQMYSSMFAFQDLNYRQFKSTYLTPVFTRAFFPETSVLVQGRRRSVIPLVQTFPLNNPAANAGKIMFLLDSDYFSALLSSQADGPNPTVYVTDGTGAIIKTVGDVSLIPEKWYEDGQHRITIAGKPYILSVVTSSQSGLRFSSLLSLKEINAMLNPLWWILAFLSVGMFLTLGLFSLYMLERSNRAWTDLVGLVGASHAPLPYEQAVGYIKSVVEQDRSSVRDAGGIPFITDAFFRRLIHGKMLGTSEIQAMLKQVQKDIDLTSVYTYQMVHIAIQESHEYLSSGYLQDIDFTRIAAQKQARHAFGEQYYLYMDYSFSIWIMLWHVDKAYLDHQITLFWKEFQQVAPCSTTMAVSSPKQRLEDIFSATNECGEVQQSLVCEKQGEMMRRFSDLSLRHEPYQYTADMERRLSGAVLKGDEQGLEEILKTIEQDNFVLRSLATQEHANLMKVLYATAIKLGQTLHLHLCQSMFSSFSEAKQFFRSQAQAIRQTRSDKDELLLQRIISYIHDRYADPSLNLSNMATDFSLKESFLYHFIQTKMDTSFAQYLEQYRLERAASLFAEKQMTIGEITLLCGYANPQTFRRAFQKRFGMLPSDYQKMVLYQKQ